MRRRTTTSWSGSALGDVRVGGEPGLERARAGIERHLDAEHHVRPLVFGERGARRELGLGRDLDDLAGEAPFHPVHLDLGARAELDARQLRRADVDAQPQSVRVAERHHRGALRRDLARQVVAQQHDARDRRREHQLARPTLTRREVGVRGFRVALGGGHLLAPVAALEQLQALVRAVAVGARHVARDARTVEVGPRQDVDVEQRLGARVVALAHLGLRGRRIQHRARRLDLLRSRAGAQIFVLRRRARGLRRLRRDARGDLVVLEHGERVALLHCIALVDVQARHAPAHEGGDVDLVHLDRAAAADARVLRAARPAHDERDSCDGPDAPGCHVRRFSPHRLEPEPCGDDHLAHNERRSVAFTGRGETLTIRVARRLGQVQPRRMRSRPAPIEHGTSFTCLPRASPACAFVAPKGPLRSVIHHSHGGRERCANEVSADRRDGCCRR